MSHKMSQSVGKSTPIIRDTPAGYTNDSSAEHAPHVGGLLSHDCKRERGGTKTAGLGPYVLTVVNAPGENSLPPL